MYQKIVLEYAHDHICSDQIVLARINNNKKIFLIKSLDLLLEISMCLLVRLDYL